MSKSMESELKEILANSKERIQEAAIAQINSSITSSVSWRVKDEVEKMTTDFIEEIRSEIQESLKENKETLIKAINKGIIDSVALLGEKMAANAVKNLEYDYKANEIISNLVKN